jgi:subfamily B ATP-binding cassette protein MsbA
MNKVTRRNSLSSPLSEFLGTAVISGVIIYGGQLILNSESNLSGEEFIMFIVIFSQILNPAKALSKAYYSIKKGAASIDRINKVLDAEEEIDIGTQDLEHFQYQIEYRNVSFKYGDEYVLKNVNLTIPKGKTVALVGQSGSGKSTLADLLPRFYDLEEGEVLIDGINVKDLKLKSLRRLMGNVNQDPILFNASIAENIAFGLETASQADIEQAARISNAHEFILETENGYATNIGDRGSKLSGGQRQRISIARAVLNNPPVMILDEATSALDTESERLVQDALSKLMQNRTSLVIAHRLSTIKNADEICVMHRGEIIERGTHAELLAKGETYKKLHDLQAF